MSDEKPEGLSDLQQARFEEMRENHRTRWEAEMRKAKREAKQDESHESLLTVERKIIEIEEAFRELNDTLLKIETRLRNDLVDRNLRDDISHIAKGVGLLLLLCGLLTLILWRVW